MTQNASVGSSSQSRTNRNPRDVNASSSGRKRANPDSHDANATSSSRRRTRQGSRSEGNRDKAPATSHTSVKKCEIFFRNEAIPKDMNLHVRSSSRRTLVYLIHRKDINPLELVAHLNKVIGPITDVSSTQTPTGSKLEVYAPDDALYTALRDTPVTFKGTSLKAVVPTPAGINIHKVNFRGAPPNWRQEDFMNNFGIYGEILEISRYFLEVNRNKVFVGQGFIFFRNGFQECPSIPKTINLGNGCSIHTMVHGAPKSPKVTNATDQTTQVADQSIHPTDNPKERRRRNRKKGPKYDGTERIDPKEEERCKPTSLVEPALLPQQQQQQRQQQQQQQQPWLDQDLLPGRYPHSQSGPFFFLYALIPLFMIVFQLFHRD